MTRGARAAVERCAASSVRRVFAGAGRALVSNIELAAIRRGALRAAARRQECQVRERARDRTEETGERRSEIVHGDGNRKERSLVLPAIRPAK